MAHLLNTYLWEKIQSVRTQYLSAHILSSYVPESRKYLMLIHHFFPSTTS